jgi:hypothetical protein
LWTQSSYEDVSTRQPATAGSVERRRKEKRPGRTIIFGNPNAMTAVNTIINTIGLFNIPPMSRPDSSSK